MTFLSSHYILVTEIIFTQLAIIAHPALYDWEYFCHIGTLIADRQNNCCVQPIKSSHQIFVKNDMNIYELLSFKPIRKCGNYSKFQLFLKVPIVLRTNRKAVMFQQFKIF